MDRNTTITTITGLAEQLCDPRHHVERVPYWDTNRNRKFREWRTTQPGLLSQLHEAAVEPVDGLNEPGPRRTPGSRPPLALEALSTHTAIAAYTARWCWSLRVDLRDTVEDNIRAMVGRAPTLDDGELTALASEMRQWYRWAATATRWIAPPFEPHVPCPSCEKTGKLRVNLHAQVAHCRGCQNTWAADDGSIFALGEYIQAHTSRKAAA
ncbi:hypothetical protein M2302_000283 [Micromonospora sp. A200]|uniref:DUF7341 domain-containing protein n=1 Tax=Micromonospora sp. A200 TaxID=2940568 RepID=UPI0024733298|nr:hypothetical protein [Micromonospora sp. A200]MDH6460132.1 hypothetical protein [Micromonospora sp. A200]